MQDGKGTALPEDAGVIGGRRFVSYISMFPENERGQHSGVFILPLGRIAVDAAEQSAAEAYGRLAVLRGSIADFVHDVNGILTSLNANVFFLGETRHSAKDKADMLDNIQRGLDRLKGITDSLALLSNDDSEDVVGFTDVSDVLCATAESSIADSDVDVRYHIRRPLHIRMNPSSFARIVQNLILNAVQAMDRRGVLVIRAEEVSGGQDLRIVEIAIADSGCGMPPEDLPRIFDRHFSTTGNGRGLGLAIVKSLVDAHHGMISVVSSPGQGSTFTLRFPASRPYGNEP